MNDVIVNTIHNKLKGYYLSVMISFIYILLKISIAVVVNHFFVCWTMTLISYTCYLLVIVMLQVHKNF